VEVGLGKSQVGAILNGGIRRPPEWHLVRGLVEAFYKYAHDRGREQRLSIRSGLDEYQRPGTRWWSTRSANPRGRGSGRTGPPVMPADQAALSRSIRARCNCCQPCS
jgi:hypothetical protein